jgi:two-component system sensor histidine kinase YesM
MLILALIPLYLFVISIFSWGREILATQITSAMRTAVTYNLGLIESEFLRIQRLQLELTEDSDLHDIAVMGQFTNEFDWTAAVNRVQRRMALIKDSSTLVDNLSVHIFSIGKSINTPGNPAGSFADIGAERQDLEKLNDPAHGPVFFSEKKIFKRIAYPALREPNEEPVFSIDADFSVEKLRAAIVHSSAAGEGGAVLFTSDGSFQLSGGPQPDVTALVVAASLAKRGSGSLLDPRHRRFLFVSAFSEPLRIGLARYLPEDEALRPLQATISLYLIFTALFTVIIVAFGVYSYRTVHKPLRQMMLSFQDIETGDLTVRIEHRQHDEFEYLFHAFNQMVEYLQTLIGQVYQHKILAQEAELKQLQAQINPHFLYNSYFLLHRMIKNKDWDNSEKFSKLMGRYFQFITHISSDETRLMEEVEHARIYAELQSHRFVGRISVSFGQLPKDAETILVPRMILQPLLENAFEHALDKELTSGLLRVWFEVDGGAEKSVRIYVEDSGGVEGLDLEAIRAGLDAACGDQQWTALGNIHRRLALRFGVRAGLSVFPSKLGGLGVRVELPCTGY